jgi:hypothetical protein
MGCGASKSHLEQVDDSVHVMLKHDRKVAAKKGKPAATGYKPRAEHPLLHTTDEQEGTTTAEGTQNGTSKTEEM